jgi:hypothetical protein
MEMPLEDKALRHTVEREVAKLTQGIDTSLMSIMVINGVVYIGGRVRPWKGVAGRGVEVKKQLALVQDQLTLLRGVSQVVIDAIIETPI